MVQGSIVLVKKFDKVYNHDNDMKIDARFIYNILFPIGFCFFFLCSLVMVCGVCCYKGWKFVCQFYDCCHCEKTTEEPVDNTPDEYYYRKPRVGEISYV